MDLRLDHWAGRVRKSLRGHEQQRRETNSDQDSVRDHEEDEEQERSSEAAGRGVGGGADFGEADSSEHCAVDLDYLGLQFKSEAI